MERHLFIILFMPKMKYMTISKENGECLLLLHKMKCGQAIHEVHKPHYKMTMIVKC